jgi:hypothetical protein
MRIILINAHGVDAQRFCPGLSTGDYDPVAGRDHMGTVFSRRAQLRRCSASSRASCSRVCCRARSITSFDGRPCRAVVRKVTIVPATMATTMRKRTSAVDMAAGD